MNKRPVFHLIAFVTLVIGLSMGLCAALSFYWNDPSAVQHSLLAAALCTIIPALALLGATRGNLNLSRRDGFAVVTLGWVFAGLFGALPYIFSGVIPDPVAAVFETVSGFTTTGASVLPSGHYPSLESVPRGILFWRALTHWFGGMGVLVLCVAVLPFLGVGGMQLYRAEMPGPSKDRLTPRIATTAKLLWGVYALLTLLEALLLRFVGGMNGFDAVCHSFATVATGGFSTRTESIAAFGNPYAEGIIILFMFLAGINFSLHYYALIGRPGRYFRDPEFHCYFFILAGCSAFVALNLWSTGYAEAGRSLRDGIFTTVSIMTTTGFCTADFDRWPDASRLLLVLLMFVGGCAGSTGGGMKVMRMVILIKLIHREIKLFMRPPSVISLKFGGKPLEQEPIAHITAFFIIFVLVFGAAAFLMTFFTPNLETAVTSVAATLGNIGPGLNAVGATQNYAAIPAAGQSVLILCMLLGRLELYTVLILFLPGFWKR